MSYIDLESVGSTVTSEGVVFPQDISEPPVTSSDADEMMGVSIFEVCDEWIENLSCEDLISLVSFLTNLLFNFKSIIMYPSLLNFLASCFWYLEIFFFFIIKLKNGDSTHG